MQLQNTKVYVGLVGEQTIAQTGDTTKYFLNKANGETERIFVDGCTSDTKKLFIQSGLQSYVQHSIQGGTSALFLSGTGITKLSDYDRKSFMSDLCRAISQSMSQYDPDMSMTYAFIGVTDSKVVDFHRDRTVTADRLAHGLGGLQHEVEDWDMVEEKILRGATLPFVLSLHFESLGDNPTNGHLCVVDMNLVNWAPPIAPEACSSSILQKSTAALSNLIHLLANDGILTGVSLPDNALVSLIGEFLYGESKTAFVMFVGSDEGARSDMPSAVDLIKSVRKLKSREITRAVDRRVLFFYEKAKYYQGEKYRLQDELTDAAEEKEQVEKDLDDIQRDFGEERESLAREVDHWQKKSSELEATLESLRAESEGNEADARWENARLVTDKLALKDELRRAEIEMAAAEESKSKLLDLYESLQASYDSLDGVYSELLAAYRMLKERLGQTADERAELQLRVEELEQQAHADAAAIEKLHSDLQSTRAAGDQQLEEAESRHAKEVEQLENKLAEETQQSRELKARITSLETTNKSLTASQSKEISSLQATIAELSSQLEAAETSNSSELASSKSSLRSAERQIKKLEADNSKLQAKLDDAANADGEQWQQEREQLQRQIRRLQQTAENSQRREAELREESERQWSAWESEKVRNHEKYLALKAKLRKAVEFAADVQVKLDTEREGGSTLESAPAEDPEPPQKAAPRKKPNPRARKQPPAKPASPAESDTELPQQQRRRRHQPSVNYTEPDTSKDTNTSNGAGTDNALPSAGMAQAAHDSDDSEISFNPRAMTPKNPKKKPTRAKKSAKQLNAELSTQPARKRPESSESGSPKRKRNGTSQSQDPESPKRRRNGHAGADASGKAVSAEPSSDIASASTALKKKRKLNLSRMRNLLGLGAERPAAESTTQAVKFTVPKIRSAAPTNDADSD
ncbi:hypothetical protein IWW40_003389 [Coemansia sp. RSA 1250]|nr:hypothetical protein IWW40_003389 [Coemansia sp. RSA 1250]